MARKNPVNTCMVKHANSIEPKFHHVEMLVATGRRPNKVRI